MRVINRFHISESMYLPLFQHIDNLHRNCIDLNGFIKVISIVQVIEMKFSMRDTMHSGKITIDLDGILDFILTLPLYVCLLKTDYPKILTIPFVL